MGSRKVSLDGGRRKLYDYGGQSQTVSMIGGVMMWLVSGIWRPIPGQGQRSRQVILALSIS